jgi:tight adherence protein B
VDTPVLIATAAAAGTVLLLFLALTAGRRESATDRIKSYATSIHTETLLDPEERRRSQASLRGALSNSAALGAFNRAIERRSWSEEMARDLARADLALRPGEYVAIRVGVILLAVGICYLLGSTAVPGLLNPLVLIAAGFTGFVLPRLYIARRQAQRLRAFNQALADTITLVANALRSGSSFLQSIELVVRETQPPVSTEFSRVVREVSLGRPLEQALQNLVRRVGSDDLELMTVATTIQYQVGGNLAEILDTISFTIRERVRIKGEIRTLTAQQRLSGYVVGFLPIALVGVLSVLAPRFMSPMFERPPEVLGLPFGVILLSVGATMMAIGFMFIRRIVNIKV